MGKSTLRWIGACSSIWLLSACGVAYGTPDREENFAVQGGECSARWWLEPLVDDVPDEASSIASQALADSKVSPSELEDWKDTIVESQSGDQQIPEHRLESYAYVEAVRADVRSELEAAGFPDAPTRVIEVYSDSNCD